MVFFHKKYILNKLTYIIPLTYDLIEDFDNINNYISNKKFNKDNLIYNKSTKELFFKVNTNKNINKSKIRINYVYI